VSLKDLRGWLERLREEGDLVAVSDPTSPKFGIAAGIRKTSDVGGPALLFENVVGSEIPAAGALYASRRRLLWGFETDADGFFTKFERGLANPMPPKVVDDAPCQEVVLEGDDARFDVLPICTHNDRDAGPFVTMGLQFATHPEYGGNVSISRMQIYDSKTAGMLSVPPQHLGVYYAEAEARGAPLEVAVTLGNDVYTTMASQLQGSIYLDEMTVAGGWMNEPVEMVRCKTIDVSVPATSEIVLEGVMPPGERRLEGPFGEYPGYYCHNNLPTDQPVFRLQAITHRRDPVYLAGLTGEPLTDNHVLKHAVYEASVYGRLHDLYPTVRDVCFTDASAGAHLVVSLRPTFETQSRDLMLTALFAERIRPKHVIVVDEDIDPRDPAQVEWAMAFRVQADRDVVVLPRMWGFPLDPSAPKPWVGTVMGTDATRPFGQPFADKTHVPGAEDFQIPGWERR
jgi:4-hydroxy-3-polyprenylbenzoate decarboxylase/2,5-furandicarboxylate decarboxylase 1